MGIGINLGKAKEISHEMRRQKRAEEFAPLDIKVSIPSESEAAEAARQAIRDKYAAIQTEIDNSSSVEALKQIVDNL